MKWNETLVYGIGITMFDHIGPVRAKQLIASCGSLEEVFTCSRSAMELLPQIRPGVAESIISQRGRVLEQARRELDRMHQLDGNCVMYDDLHYPQRLKECEDAPLVLYYRGKVDFNPKRMISVVGTRRASAYGRSFCEELALALVPFGVTVVSGLAFGIDVMAHRAAVANGLPTIACVGHGLQTIYPADHRSLAEEMLANGGIVTEFTTTQKMCAELFPMRNRLIAGLSDATIVVESDVKGGSMITAYLAHSYNREVFAVPGRIHDRSSMGCNDLIQRQVAAMITGPASLIDALNWHRERPDQGSQLQLFQQLTPIQQTISDGFDGRELVSLDELMQRTGLDNAQMASHLLEMEFSGLVRVRPGSRYELLHRGKQQTKTGR